MIKLSQILAVFLFLCSGVVYAQQPDAANAGAGASANTAPANPAATNAAPVNPAPAEVAMTPEEINKPFTGSFFLTPLEIVAIQQALKGRVTKSQALAGQSGVIPPHRIIRVSGVLYRSPADWIVWMNNEKVTPSNLLPEIIDINVKPSSKVSLEWYDVGLNQVLSITLRPHQTYDITTGILLPQ